MKKLIPALILICLFVSAAAAELNIVPDGGTAPDGTVNFGFPAHAPFVPGAPMGGHSYSVPIGHPPYGPAVVSPFYWASYPMVPVPMVPPSGPIDAWAERQPPMQ